MYSCLLYDKSLVKFNTMSIKIKKGDKLILHTNNIKVELNLDIDIEIKPNGKNSYSISIPKT